MDLMTDHPYDLRGRRLKPGCCMVHPHVEEPYPCRVCLKHSGHPLSVAWRRLLLGAVADRNAALDALRALLPPGAYCPTHPAVDGDCARCRAALLVHLTDPADYDFLD